MPQDKLKKALLDLQGKAADRKTLQTARTLFAHALDTPGGLKIQTMHAFCESLLHRFPFEANVPGHFEVLDEQGAEALLIEARDRVFARLGDEGTPLRDALNRLLARHTDMTLNGALRDVISKRTLIDGWIVRTAGHAGTGASIGDVFANLRTAFGLEPGDDAGAIAERFFAGNRFQLVDDSLRELVGACRANPSSRNDDAADLLERIAAAHTPTIRAEYIFDFYLKSDREPRKAGSRVTKAAAGAIAGFEEMFDADAGLCVDLVDLLNGLETVEETEALLTIGYEILQVYRTEKDRRGLLDYDDLIARTNALLASSEAAAWVLYKLDSRIDHILIDEAQDTSPPQWSIIDALAGDFFTGETASDKNRTIFAVGDDKQSIYSFQGAEPKMLSEMERRFFRLVEHAGLAFARAPLSLSFRSTRQILDAVDTVFAKDHASRVTSGDYENHSANRTDERGHVVVWPRLVEVKDEPPEDWTEAWDTPTQVERRLAEDIAGEIRRLLKEERTLPSGEPVKAGEILILVRKRDAFFTAMNRALRAAGIATAGADRIAVSSHIAVLDCLALADVMLLPEDDLQLAVCLKSPLIGLGDDDLTELAAGREGSLWQSLGSSNDPHHVEAMERLVRWRAMADQVTPFRFYSRVLGPDGGRSALTARLGSEADDVLDTFLSEALAYEHTEPPSLQGFTARIRTQTNDIKRESDERAEDVRIMTVHGAKGLEADIVFLVDTGSQIASPSSRDPLLKFGDPAAPALFLRQGGNRASQIEKTYVQAEEGLSSDEYARLLYVGMTRARDLLYLCGIRRVRTPDDCWYRMAADALVPDDSEREDGELTAPFVWPDMLEGETQPAREADGTVLAEGEATGEGVLPLAPGRPAWLDEPAPQPPHAPEPLRPSRALAEPDPAGEPLLQAAADSLAGPAAGLAAAMQRGQAIHTLLQHLPGMPAADRNSAAEAWLIQNFPEAAAHHGAWIAEACSVIDHPDLADLFGHGSRAEVPIAGYAETEAGQHAVSGQIDRLAIAGSRVQIADFKTDRAIPAGSDAVDPAYLTQLALYRRLVMQASGASSAEAMLVWTSGPVIMKLPEALLEDALSAIGVLPMAAA
jgi:ATP-dependent helicase/nuclease subunit A